MFFEFKNLGIELEVENGITLINKNDFLKPTKQNEFDDKLLLVLQHPKTFAITTITHFGDIDEKKEVNEIVRILTEQNIKNGYILNKYEKEKSTDDRCLHILSFFNKEQNLFLTLSTINSHLFLITTTTKNDTKESLYWNLNISKSLSPNK